MKGGGVEEGCIQSILCHFWCGQHRMHPPIHETFLILFLISFLFPFVFLFASFVIVVLLIPPAPPTNHGHQVHPDEKGQASRCIDASAEEHAQLLPLDA